MGTTSTDIKFRLAMEGAAVVSSEMDRVNAALGKIEGGIGTVKNALGLLGVGLSVNYFVDMMRSSIDAADHLNDLSKTTSISVEQLVGLKLAAKQSGGDLDGIAASINKLSVNMGKDAEQFAKLGVTAKDPLEAFKQLADVFSTLKDPQLRAALGAEALGKSWASAAPLLSEGRDRIQEMVDKGTKLAGVTKEMAEKSDIFNDKLAEMQVASDAAKFKLAEEMLPTLTKLTTAFVGAYEEGGKLHALWIALGGLGALAFTDEFSSAKTKLNQVNEDLKKINKSQDDIKNAGSVVKFLYGSDELDSEASRLSKLKTDLQAEIDKPARDAAARAADTKARIADAKAEAEATAKTTEFLKLNDEARKKAAAAAAAAVKAQDSFVTGLQKEHDSLILGTEQTKLNEAATLGITGAKLELVTTLLEEDRVYKLAVVTAKERAALRQKESDDIAAYMLSQTESYNAAVKGSRDALTAAQAEYDQFGLSKSQIAEITLLTMQSTQAKFIDGTEGFNAVQKQIVAQKELIDVLRKTEIRQVGIDTAKATAEEWKKGWEATDLLARDVFSAWATEGGNAGQKIGDTLKKALLSAIYEATIKPIAFQIYASIAGMPSGGAMSALGAAGNAGSAFSGASNLYNVMSGSSALGTMYANATATGIDGLLATNAAFGTAATEATGLAGAMGGISSVLAAIPGWGWAAMGALAILGMGDHGTPTSNTGNATVFYDPTGHQTDKAIREGGSSVATDAMIANMQAAYMAGAKSLGIGTVASSFSYGGNTGKDGQSPNFALGSNAGISNFYQTETKVTDAAVSLAASQAVFSALQGSALPGYLSKVFDGLTASTMTQQQISDTLGYAQSLKTVRDALTETRTPLQILADNMKALGTTSETFKTDFVKAIDAGIGPQQLAQWQALQQSLDQLPPAAAAAAVAVRSLADIASERTKLQDQLDSLTMTSAQLLDKQRSSIDASNQSLFDQVQAATNAKSAMDAASTSMQSFIDNVTGLVAGIHASVTDSSFAMAYGLQDNAGKYAMLDGQAAGYDTAMKAATDINVIAKNAQAEIDTLNKAWSLLDATQQTATLKQYQADLLKVDSFVIQSGADALSLKKADNAALSEAVGAAVAKAQEDLIARVVAATLAQAAATAQQAAATASIEQVVRTPVQLNVTMAKGIETSIS